MREPLRVNESIAPVRLGVKLNAGEKTFVPAQFKVFFDSIKVPCASPEHLSQNKLASNFQAFSRTSDSLGIGAPNSFRFAFSTAFRTGISCSSISADSTSGLAWNHS